MDMNETSAMTESSGLAGQSDRDDSVGQTRTDHASREIWSEQLRKMTIAAPLSSLGVAFLLGILMARRR